MILSSIINRPQLFLLCMVICLIGLLPVEKIKADSIPENNPGWVRKSIYPEGTKNKSKLYNKLWGQHYRNLYTVPIRVRAMTLDSIAGGVTVIKQASELHGLYLENKDKKLYMLRPLGGSTTFIESDFFQDMYNKNDFRNTYLDQFIGDAYTIINPYTYIASDYMAHAAGLYSNNSRIYYIPENSTQDTIADGSRIQNKLVSVIDVPDINTQQNILNTNEMLSLLRKDKAYHVVPDIYIRQRMFDILTGDWNKGAENWNWILRQQNDSISIYPVVLDRNHAFTKVDGFLFKQMLNVLTLGFIYNYDDEIKNIKKFNKLGYALDIALAAQSHEADWVRQSQILQTQLSDQVIAEAFNRLPEGIEGEDIDYIQRILKERRNQLDKFAQEYYKKLQETPVITGTDHADRIVIDRNERDSIHIYIYNPGQQLPVFSKGYSRKKTDEIWIYGLEGDDTYEVTGKAGKEDPIYLIAGKGDNQYEVSDGKKIKIFSYLSGKENLEGIKGDKVFTDDEQVMDYDYTKTQYDQKSINPWGYYDSDLGINLGTFFTYTRYGFKRKPFSYQHRIGFSYLHGFMYKGTFPTYNNKNIFHLDASFGFPRNNYNFFGFGNNTDGYKDEKRNYNRVNVRELTITPSFERKIDNNNSFIFHASYQLYKVLKPDDEKFIDLYYPDEDDPIYKYNSFVDAGITYQFRKPISSFLSNLEFSVDAGWKMSLRDVKKNFPYTEARAALELTFSRRFSWATMLRGTVLYNDKYEFYQAATTALRGYRSNRFLGQYSFHEYSDLRFDMGRLNNSFAPLKYGLFVGSDLGRVWLPKEDSKKWHTSYGGGLWLTIINKITTKYSIFGSSDTVRFMFELGMGF